VTLLFKILGFVLIIFTTSAIGFLKANELNLRYKKLCNFSKSIGNLKEHIRLHSGERERLLKICFGEFPLNYSSLTKDDVELMGEFLKDFGFADTKAEYERCQLYINFINQKSDEAKQKYSELNRLYKNIGVLSGVLICIFFL
jgi:hypothetical protein